MYDNKKKNDEKYIMFQAYFVLFCREYCLAQAILENQLEGQLSQNNEKMKQIYL